jgi:chromosome segregation ATPase
VFNLAPCDTRPTLFSLAAFALLGWGLLIDAELGKADSQPAARRVLVPANEEHLTTQRAQKEQVIGSMADLQSKVERLSEVAQERDQAQAQLASVQKELERARQHQAQISHFQTQGQELSQVGAQLQQEVVKLREDLAAQSRELANVGGTLQSAQQETQRLSELTQACDQAQAQLALLQNEFESARQKRAEVSQLQIQNQELSQAWSQLQLQELSQAWAQLQQVVVKLREDLAAQDREVADVNGKLQSARQELADGHRKLADDRQLLAACRFRSR